MKKKNPVVHFELPADDRKKLAEFYSSVFGWNTNFLGEDMGNYVLVSTADTDENGMIRQAGAINGGIFEKRKDNPAKYPSLVIAVDDINEHIKVVNDAGGTVLGKPVEIPGTGTFVYFRDPAGNICSILQPVMETAENEARNYGKTGEI